MITDKVFNGLTWKGVDAGGLGAMLRGRFVCGAEPVGYPLSEGVILYLRDSCGRIMALEVEGADEGRVTVQAARVPGECWTN